MIRLILQKTVSLILAILIVYGAIRINFYLDDLFYK